MDKENTKAVIPPAEAQGMKWRISFDKLETYTEGDVVLGSMLRDTTYYQKNGMIERADDDAIISTEETRKGMDSEAAIAERVAQAQDAERKAVLTLLVGDPVNGDELPGSVGFLAEVVGHIERLAKAKDTPAEVGTGGQREDAGGAFVTDQVQSAMISEVYGTHTNPGDPGEAQPFYGRFMDAIKTNRDRTAEVARQKQELSDVAANLDARRVELTELLGKADNELANGREIISALRAENEELKKSIDELRGEVSALKTRFAASGKGTEDAPADPKPAKPAKPPKPDAAG